MIGVTDIQTHTDTHTHTHMHIYSLMHAYKHVHMHACTHACTHLPTHTHTYTHTHTHTYTHKHTHTQTHRHTHTDNTQTDTHLCECAIDTSIFLIDSLLNEMMNALAMTQLASNVEWSFFLFIHSLFQHLHTFILLK